MKQVRGCESGRNILTIIPYAVFLFVLYGYANLYHLRYNGLIINSVAFSIAVFNEGRVAIAVTKMDESYKAGKKDAKKLTEFKVKEIVSSGIQQALKLNRVSPEIVYPLSGDFAFQVCLCIYVSVGGATEAYMQ